MKEQAPSNAYLAEVVKHEGNSLVRVAEELVKCFNIDVTQAEGLKKLSAQIKQNMKDNHLKAWIAKPQHGYLFRTRAAAKDPNECYTNAWMKKSSFSAHVEGYLCAIQEDKLQSNALKAKRMKDSAISPFCRLCKNNRETIQHVIASCPRLSASMYLPLRHNKVANIIYQNLIIKSTNADSQPIQELYTDDNKEIWCDTKIDTLTTCKHNKPDIILK